MAAGTQETVPPVERSSRVFKILMPIIAVIAVAALGVAVYGLIKPQHSYAPAIRRLEAQLSQARSQINTQNRQIADLKANSQAGAVSTMQSKLTSDEATISSLRGTISQFKICIPQVEQQINSESIQTATQNGYLTDAYIQNPAIISTNCNKMLSGG
jgi:uncharacterized protein HemX